MQECCWRLSVGVFAIADIHMPLQAADSKPQGGTFHTCAPATNERTNGALIAITLLYIKHKVLCWENEMLLASHVLQSVSCTNYCTSLDECLGEFYSFEEHARIGKSALSLP